MNEHTVYEKMSALCGQALPPVTDVCSRAMESADTRRMTDPTWLKNHFDDLVTLANGTATQAYRDAELAAATTAIANLLSAELPENFTLIQCRAAIERNYWMVSQLLAAIRHTRECYADAVFGRIIHDLFHRLGYPYCTMPVVTGQADFVLPGNEHLLSDPLDCIILTVICTFGETWRELLAKRGPSCRLCVITADPDISSITFDEIRRRRVYLVMADSIRCTSYPERPDIMSFRTFFEDHLDPAMKRWRRNKVIQE